MGVPSVAEAGLAGNQSAGGAFHTPKIVMLEILWEGEAWSQQEPTKVPASVNAGTVSEGVSLPE